MNQEDKDEKVDGFPSMEDMQAEIAKLDETYQVLTKVGLGVLGCLNAGGDFSACQELVEAVSLSLGFMPKPSVKTAFFGGLSLFTAIAVLSRANGGAFTQEVKHCVLGNVKVTVEYLGPLSPEEAEATRKQVESANKHGRIF